MTAPQYDFPKTSQPAQRALVHAGYTKFEQLTTVTEKEIANLHGMGPKAIRILKAAMAERGWSFKE